MKRAPALERLSKAFPMLVESDLIAVRDAIQNDRKMKAVDRALKGFGVEYVYNASGAAVAAYSNSGDTYAPTILRNYETGGYSLTTLGDFVESYERRYGRLP
jgi:hypothetical protein